MSSTPEETNDFIRAVVAYFLPPLGVWMQVRFATAFWINCLLTLFFWLPGLIHAAWVIATTGAAGQSHPDGNKRFWALLLAPILPPASVWVARGIGTPLLVSVVLSLLFWLPGVLHAAWVATHRD